MTKTVILEWNFSPSNCFEEPIEISRENYVMVIEDGKATATIDYTTFNNNPSLRQELHDSLNNRLLGVQLFSHVPYELSHSKKIHIDADGYKHIFIELSSGTYAITGGNVDFRHTDKDGNIISDSKRDRVKKKKGLAELIAIHMPSDPLVAALLSSYQTAVTDPNNELVHLYEIREGISAKFGGENSARKILNISYSQWSRLGQLCNNEPLKQGRHRGKTIGGFRDASESELMEAREISRAMIQSYLQYLEDLTT
jgi:hypothetical protein